MKFLELYPCLMYTHYYYYYYYYYYTNWKYILPFLNEQQLMIRLNGILLRKLLMEIIFQLTKQSQHDFTDYSWTFIRRVCTCYVQIIFSVTAHTSFGTWTLISFHKMICIACWGITTLFKLYKVSNISNKRLTHQRAKQIEQKKIASRGDRA